MLKFRPAYQRSVDTPTGSETIYLRLTVSVSGKRRLLLLRQPDAGHSARGLQLPYRVTNHNPNLLLAFQQRGVRSWDTLGVNEMCAFSWDAPSSKASLIGLVVRDAHGQLRAATRRADTFGCHQAGSLATTWRRPG